MVRTKTWGFTLIELSIVLVIIGLVVGGVLAGKDLIEAAGLRKTVAQFQQYDAAVNAFKLKYNCLPGDCANATSLGFTPTNYQTDCQTCVPGNGKLEAYANSSEVYALFINLREAGLIESADPALPVQHRKLPDIYWSVGGGWWAYYVPGTNRPDGNYGFIGMNGHALTLATNSYFSLPDYPYNNIITPMEAYRLDSKMDDGYPLTGAAQGYIGSPYGAVMYGNHQSFNDMGYGGACLDNSVTPNTYRLATTGFACSIAYKASF